MQRGRSPHALTWSARGFVVQQDSRKRRSPATTLDALMQRTSTTASRSSLFLAVQASQRHHAAPRSTAVPPPTSTAARLMGQHCAQNSAQQLNPPPPHPTPKVTPPLPPPAGSIRRRLALRARLPAAAPRRQGAGGRRKQTAPRRRGDAETRWRGPCGAVVEWRVSTACLIRALQSPLRRRARAREWAQGFPFLRRGLFYGQSDIRARTERLHPVRRSSPPADPRALAIRWPRREVRPIRLSLRCRIHAPGAAHAPRGMFNECASIKTLSVCGRGSSAPTRAIPLLPQRPRSVSDGGGCSSSNRFSKAFLWTTSSVPSTLHYAASAAATPLQARRRSVGRSAVFPRPVRSPASGIVCARLQRKCGNERGGKFIRQASEALRLTSE